MRVVVPFTKRLPVVEQVLRAEAPEAEWVEMREPTSYWELLRSLWLHREDVLIVEHDVIPWPGALTELAACPGMWCSCSYHIDTGNGRSGIGLFHHLGCTKLSADLMRRVPAAFEQMPDRHWSKLDAQLCHIALGAGLIPHPHRPAVTHLK